ncbi:MAG: spore cortex biosynthesis protein YabQ [Clostridia bacterium]|nr:spore cortex biosynthesis protein YabQ [Clostridia bacterium]
MFLSSRHELYVLLGTFIGGLVLGVVFDLFRIFRKNFKGASSLVWLQDILMWAVMLAVVYITLFITNSAKVRWYEFAGFGAGIALYMVLLSRVVVAVSSAIITAFKKVLLFIFTVVLFPFRMIFKITAPPIKSFGKWISKKNRRIFHKQKCNFLRFLRIFKKI